MPAGLWYVVGYSVAVGVSLLAYWPLMIAAKQVPEIREGKREIWFHVAAEVATGLTLIGGAVATLVNHGASRSRVLSALGLGMVVYTLIQSPGYYVVRGNRAMVAMFAGV